MRKIGVLGAGTWGIALARMLSMSGNDVTVWSAIPQEIENLRATHTHPFLPGMTVPEQINFTASAAAAAKSADILLFVVPSPYVRSTAEKVAPYLETDTVIVDAAKGIEPHTHMFMSEVIREAIGKEHAALPIVALSGPTHAEEVAKDLPTTVVAACGNESAAKLVQDVFSNTCMRVYTNDDVRGVELSGALKNIIALGTGISTGLGYGDNTKAALITRGLAEIIRLGVTMGCRPETFSGLAGIGDLIVTCTSEHSRNNRAGYLIGQGKTPAEATQEVGMVVEGMHALPAAMELSEKYDVELPICSAVNDVVNGGTSPLDSVRALMGREQKPE